MIKMKVQTKIDKTKLIKLKEQLRSSYIEVGYIDSPKHWDNDFSVAMLASYLHDWSPWADKFMLSESKADQVKAIVVTEMNKFGSVNFKNIVDNIGKKLKDKIEDNIIEVNTPANSEEWASYKGVNDPLRFGSLFGQEPNLISALTYKVGKS